MSLVCCPVRHQYFDQIDTSCPICHPHPPLDLFHDSFPGAPPALIRPGGCSRTAENLNVQTEHYQRVLDDILASGQDTRRRCLNLLAFYAQMHADPFTAQLVGMQVATELRKDSIGLEVVLRVLPSEPAVRPLAEAAVRAALHDDVEIRCDRCSGALAPIPSGLLATCRKCGRPISEEEKRTRAWFRCPDCDTMTHESVWQHGTLGCTCGRRFAPDDVKRLRDRELDRLTPRVLNGYALAVPR